VGNEKIFLQSDVEPDTEAQKEKLNKDLQYLKGFLISVDRKLSNDKFVQNAKREVIELERKKKSDAEEKIRIIEQSLATIG
jgi:valyl-tRNA synthetase